MLFENFVEGFGYLFRLRDYAQDVHGRRAQQACVNHSLKLFEQGVVEAVWVEQHDVFVGLVGEVDVAERCGKFVECAVASRQIGRASCRERVS